MTRKEKLSGELKKYIATLKENGFRVFLPDGENPTFCIFSHGEHIGYVEHTDYGFNFSTVHKPNHICGTGYSVSRKVPEPTIKDAMYCFINRPAWASINDPVEKYSSIEAYFKSPVNQILNYKEVAHVQ